VYTENLFGQRGSSGIYVGNGSIISYKNGKLVSVLCEDFLDCGDNLKIYVGCMGSFPVGFPSIAARAKESLKKYKKKGKNKFSDSDSFTIDCIVDKANKFKGEQRVNDTDLISICSRYLLIDSWGTWEQPFIYIKEKEELTNKKIEHIKEQIQIKEEFNSVSKVWDRNKRYIRKSLNQHQGIIGTLRSELAFISDDYAQHQEQVMEDHAIAMDFVDELAEGVEQEIALLARLLIK
jgi:hypothetical protein